MKMIIEKLRTITHDQVRPLLEARSQLDPKAWIVIVKLDITPITGDLGQQYDFYAARVLPAARGNQNYVNSHYHLRGNEPYRFLSKSTGEMNIGTMRGDEVAWNIRKTTAQDDEIIMQGGEVHSFRNTSDTPVDFVFSCPASHLVDNEPKHPEGDRYFTRSLKNGVPPWYSDS